MDKGYVWIDDAEYCKVFVGRVQVKGENNDNSENQKYLWGPSVWSITEILKEAPTMD